MIIIACLAVFLAIELGLFFLKLNNIYKFLIRTIVVLVVLLFALVIAWFIIEATSDEDMTELVESTTVQIYQDEGGAFVFGDDAAPFVEVSQQDAYGDLHKIEAANYEPWYISRRQDGIALVSVWFESGYIVEIDRGWEGVPCIEEVVRKTPRTGVYFWFWPAQKSYTYIRVPE